MKGSGDARTQLEQTNVTRIVVDLLTDPGNYAVVRLPDRKFPGVLIQGDSLNVLLGAVDEASTALAEGNPVEAAEIIKNLTDRLKGIRDRTRKS